MHPSPAGHSTVPVSCTSLPAVYTSVVPLERPLPLPSLHTQPLWTAPLSPGMLFAVPGSGHQQLASTASQPPPQVPATIWGKVQCSEYIDLSELLMYNFQYKYSRLDDSQALEIVDGKLSLAPQCKPRHLLPCSCGSGHGIHMKILFSVSIPAGTRSCCTTGTTSQTWTNISTGQEC